MKINANVFLLLISLCFPTYNAETDPDYPIELSDETFEDFIASDSLGLVMFYAPWCGHCQSLKPEFEKAAKKLANSDPPVRLARIDCTQAGINTCKDYEIGGYPTLKIFRDDDSSGEDYNGPRDAAGIVKHMRSQSSTGANEITSQEELLTFLATEDVCLVGYFDNTDTQLKEDFVKFAKKKWDRYNFGYTAQSELVPENVPVNTIVLYRPKQLWNKFEENSVEFIEDSSENLEAFAKGNSRGLAGIRTPENQDDFDLPLLVCYYSMDFKLNAKMATYWRNRILLVAKHFGEQLNVAISDPADFPDEMSYFDLTDSDFTIPKCGLRSETSKKYVLEDPFSVENVTEFVQNFIDNKLEPRLKSQEIPLTNDEPVKVAVARNFDEVVKDNGMDTLVGFYAPWCGHCKQMEPIYNKLAEDMRDEEIVFVKMDATENDIPEEFSVEGFPTLYWVSKDRTVAPLKYAGGRQQMDFIKFIAEHASGELKKWDRNGKPREEVEEKKDDVGKDEL